MSFFGDIAKTWDKTVGQAGKEVAKVLPQPVRKAVRYTGVATTAILSGGLLPTSVVRKSFGLSPGESSQAEIGLKVTRGITAAVLTAGTASYIAGPSSVGGESLSFSDRLYAGASILKTKLGVGTALDRSIAATAQNAGYGGSASNLIVGANGQAVNAFAQPSGIDLIRPASPSGIASYSSKLGLGKDIQYAALSPSTSTSGFWSKLGNTAIDTTASVVIGKSLGAVGNTPAAFRTASPDQSGGLSKPIDISGPGGNTITNSPANTAGGAGDPGGGGSPALAGVSPIMLAGAFAVAAFFLLHKKKHA